MRNAIALFFIAAAAVWPQTDLQPVATVRLTKTEPITVKQLKTAVENFEKASGEKLDMADRRKVLDSLIDERLMLQGAERDKVSITESELNQNINQFRTLLSNVLGRPPTESEFADAIRQETGMDIPTFREQMRRELTKDKYLQAKKPGIGDQPSDAEIKKFYQENATQIAQPEIVEFSAVVLPYRTDAEKASARSEAGKIAKEIGGKASAFDQKIVQGRSNNPLFRSVERQMLAREDPTIPEKFKNTAFSLDQGKISDVLEVPAGDGQGYFAIIKVTGNYDKKLLEIDDIMLIVPPALKAQLGGRPLTVRMYITAGLSQQKLLGARQELISELRKGNPFTVDEKLLNY